MNIKREGARFVENCRFVNISAEMVNILLVFFKIKARKVKLFLHKVKLIQLGTFLPSKHGDFKLGDRQAS
jgi:hypothetical protein